VRNSAIAKMTTQAGRRIVVIAAIVSCLIIAAIAGIATGGKSIAEVWYQWDANSLVGLQSLVEKRIDPDPEDPTLYFDVVLPVLEQPFWLAVLVVLLLLDLLPLALVLKAGARALPAPPDEREPPVVR